MLVCCTCLNVVVVDLVHTILDIFTDGSTLSFILQNSEIVVCF